MPRLVRIAPSSGTAINSALTFHRCLYAGANPATMVGSDGNNPWCLFAAAITIDECQLFATGFHERRQRITNVGPLMPPAALLVLHVGLSAFVGYVGFRTDRTLWRLCVPWPLRLLAAASFAGYLPLPILRDAAGVGAYLVLVPAALAMMWAHGIAPRFGLSGRRYVLSVAYRRLYGLERAEPSAARTRAALEGIRFLDRLHGGPDDRFARLMQATFHQILIDQTMSGAEVDDMVREVNDGMLRLDC